MSLAGCAYGFDDDYSTTIREENKQLRAEINEQARLLGVSAEKELALRAENERLKAKLELAEVKKDASRWFSLVMNAVAELEDAANCLQDSDAKQTALRAASYYRNEAMEGK